MEDLETKYEKEAFKKRTKLLFYVLFFIGILGLICYSIYYLIHS